MGYSKTKPKGNPAAGSSNLPIGLAQPARRALTSAGYWRLEQLTNISEAEIAQLHGVGPHALDQLRRALRAKGLAFATGNRPKTGSEL